ncbi:MAG: porin, partial [Acidiferrobacter sp.]
MKKQSLLTAAVAAACFAGGAHATNWFQLQGTEPNGIAAPVHVFGFIQPTYQDTGGSAVNGLTTPTGASSPYNGAVPKFNEVAPQNTSMRSFNMLRARIAVRGTVLPISNKIDYFIMAEFGNNSYTGTGGYTPRLTDASVTFNEIPGMRVRVGLFKTPGPEEILQGIPDFNYINFTNVGAQLIQSQFISGLAYQPTNGPAQG